MQNAIVKKTTKPVKTELKNKNRKLCHRDVLPLEISTLESILSDTADQIDKDDEELLIFTKVLDLMQVPIPEQLQDKSDIILKDKRIRKTPATDPDKKKNRFLSYTPNEKLSEVCDKLSLEEVLA